MPLPESVAQFAGKPGPQIRRKIFPPLLTLPDP